MLLFVLSAISAAAAATIDKRVSGGVDAKDDEFPFIVSIQTSSHRSINYSHSCGGTLLDSTTVLTAAHCIPETPEGWNASVKAGSLNSTAGGIDIRVASVRMHPEYILDDNLGNGAHEVNDIAIIKLSTPIKESEKIRYAKLPADGLDPAVNSSAVVAGWGSQERIPGPHGSIVDALSKVVIPIRAREDCYKLDESLRSRDTIVCAGGDGKNTCKADSGGPLVDLETQQVIGVVSYGLIGKGEEQRYCDQAPTVFTRVGSYIPFITENLGGSGSGSGDQ